ncbi:MAG: DUF4230 domain-containing protein [Patescibacteria group bacterium]|jgi:hypothetical protein
MKPLKWGVILGVAALLFVGGLALGYRVFHPAGQKTTVTAQVILTALRDRGFLVTQTYVFDEPVTIEKSSGSAFKDFFFGQTITARGVMEANVGIDLANMSADDIAVQGDTVTVSIPAASLFNVRPIGPIEVKNQRGILKRLIENDTGYNEALAELTRQAEEAAKKPELMERATARAQEDVARLLGYVAQGKTIAVKIK